jgi:hypothetical protein
MRNKRKTESQGLRRYYSGIGKLNLLSSEQPLGIESYPSDEFYGTSMAIVECCDDRLSIINNNDRFNMFLESIRLKSIEEAEELLNRGRGKLHSNYLSAALIARDTGRSQIIDS